jgi:hypothetical protein
MLITNGPASELQGELPKIYTLTCPAEPADPAMGTVKELDDDGV